MSKLKLVLLAASAMLAMAFTVSCSGDDGSDGKDGVDGTPGTNGINGVSCSLKENTNGTATLTCGDKTFTIKNGENGDPGAPGAAGAPGADGEGCTLEDNGDGTAVLTCGGVSINITIANDVSSSSSGEEDISSSSSEEVSSSSSSDNSCTLWQNAKGTVKIVCGVDEVVIYCGGNTFNPATDVCRNDAVLTYTTLTDSRDGIKYKAIEIDGAVWMAENLNYVGTLGSEIGACYGDDDDNCDAYGRLYNWTEASAACPTGWHLPEKTEWEALATFVGNDAEKLKAKSAGGTDDVGFAALLGGFISASPQNIGAIGRFWNIDEDIYDNSDAYYLQISTSISQNTSVKTNKFSVRCVKD